MANGEIQKINAEKGFGFILPKEPAQDKGVFFHFSGLVKGLKINVLQTGDRVEFDMTQGPKGDQAINIRKTSGQTTNATSSVAERNHLESNSSKPRIFGSDIPSEKLTYRFAPIDINLAVTDSPVWHDGLSDEGLLSGEILCTLKALTPLLPGNTSYPASDVADSKKVTIKEPVIEKNKDKKLDRDRVQLPNSWGIPPVAEKKKIIEPLRLNDGRAIIPGSAIKGMIRQSLGALLSAPMERVNEHHYTYRPNLSHGNRMVCRPAVVLAINEQRITVKILNNARAAIFFHDDTQKKFAHLAYGSVVNTEFSDISYEEKNYFDNKKNKQVNEVNRNRLVTKSESSLKLNHIYLAYKGGIDGEGDLASAFGRGTKVHSEALVHLDELGNGSEMTIPAPVYNQYIKSQKVLANETVGHISKGHPLSINSRVVSRNIESATALVKNQLIYVEVEIENNEFKAIKSIGHHYQYRWAYTSSIKVKNGKQRDEVALHKDEVIANDEKLKNINPLKLSGPRLIFGYTRSETTPIGKGKYERLAGRIAINHAVSVGVPQYLNPVNGFCVPLKILGQPKPSAWEFYLKQNESEPVTYGNLPSDEGGDLAGRKFYLHQLGTALADIQALPNNEDTNKCPVRSDQAPLARFICDAGTEFKFAIRYSQLRPWELGALLVTLQPNRIGENTKKYAHKLGLGRPLGLGSVEITEAILPSDITKKAVDALNVRLDKVDAIRSRWLEIHEFADRGQLGYPTVTDRGEKTIFGWHSQLRREYSKLRRDNKPNFDLMMNEKINPAHNLPPKKIKT